MRSQKAKSVKDSEVIMTEVVYPNDANPMGMLQGGRLVQWMDTASAVCAQTHTDRIAVTALMDKVVFTTPAKVGDIITIRAKLVAAFNTSVEVLVRAWSRKVISGETHAICEAYFTFVALDSNASPAPVAKLTLSTEEEHIMAEQAALRKKQRKANESNVGTEHLAERSE
jgi:acyl-CoA hydrolase